MTQILSNIFAVEVPNGTTALTVMSLPDGRCILAQAHIIGAIGQMELPAGNWEALFTTKDCTEEQAATVVEKENGYNAYKEYERDGPWVNEIANNSLQSLLRSHGLDPNKNYLLLKRIDL